MNVNVAIIFINKLWVSISLLAQGAQETVFKWICYEQRSSTNTIKLFAVKYQRPFWALSPNFGLLSFLAFLNVRKWHKIFRYQFKRVQLVCHC